MEDKELIKEMYQSIKNNNISKVQQLTEQNTDILDKKTVFGSFLDVASFFGMYDIAESFICCYSRQPY